MDIYQGNSSESLLLASVSDSEVISRFLGLPLVKALKFLLAVTLRIGSRNRTKLKA